MLNITQLIDYVLDTQDALGQVESHEQAEHLLVVLALVEHNLVSVLEDAILEAANAS